MIVNANVGQVLRAAAARHGDRVALVDVAGDGGEAPWSYGALDRAALGAAAALRARGVGPGERVALLAGNGASYVAAWFGAIYAGATVVPIPTVAAPPELRARLVHARCRAVVFDAERAPLVSAAGGVPGWPLAEVVAQPSDDAAHFVAVDARATALILYTSGTTGRAKGAMIAHASLVAHTTGLLRHTIGLGEDDVVLAALPLTHSFGCRMGLLLALAAGARVVLMRRFDAAHALARMARDGATFLPAVPTMLAAVSAQPGPPPGRLRWCLSAGAPLADTLCRRAEERLGCEVRQGYGLTEATFSTMDAPPAPRALGSVGRPVAGVELRLGPGDEIQVRGPHVMTGYLDDPAATAAAFDDGWLRTGDIGRLDGEGRLWIIDRAKDLIIRGGNNVYPSEVEGVLAAHPEVAEVAVIGRPDDYYGEEVVAVIVPRPGTSPSPSALVAFARAHLAATKVPRELAFVSALPFGASGKVVRRALRQQLIDGTLVTLKP